MQESSTASKFKNRHIGPTSSEQEHMLKSIGFDNLDKLIQTAVPEQILEKNALDLRAACSENEILDELKGFAAENKLFKNYIGQGYHDTLMPPVIQRNILENPGWYTAYTPYQAEISQGRLEVLLNFQTIITGLTGMEISNSSLLDEATAAAEAMTLSLRVQKKAGNKFFVSNLCLPQSIAVVKTRAKALGIEVVVGNHKEIDWSEKYFATLLQYPDANGNVEDYSRFCKEAHENSSMVIVSADLLSLTLLTAPGEFGADIVVGSSQRFGVPLSFGGPHAAFLATRDKFKRQIPGRIIGISKDSNGNTAYRMALQTREQHIRRDKATSNICTAQVLPAVLAAMYAIYHGPEGLIAIATKIHRLTKTLESILVNEKFDLKNDNFFDAIKLTPKAASQSETIQKAQSLSINLHSFKDGDLGISISEKTEVSDLSVILESLGVKKSLEELNEAYENADSNLALRRDSLFMQEPVFNSFRSELDITRYISKLESKDLTLCDSMIPLGSCTMKLNATAEMMPITFPGFADLHPMVPETQSAGYQKLFTELSRQLTEITGMAGISLQPNAGSQGEYAGLLAIKGYHEDRGDFERDTILIPSSAHGTNPASAIMAGLKVKPIRCDEEGNINVEELTKTAKELSNKLFGIMITYPSTHGVFEDTITNICSVIHENGGLVYLDGANMNAMVGLCKPGHFGADVCHLNLHKTFCIPHGGGGPGMGPICAAERLLPYMPSDPMNEEETGKVGAVAASHYSSANILNISYAYIRMMGAKGLRDATEVAILNANYIAKRLNPHYPVLYRGNEGLIAHECIIDIRPIKAKCGIEAEDIAKRLMDYGFHAPTMSWPVIGTMMIEPTESENLAEIDRFCDAMIQIREEIKEVEENKVAANESVLKKAPHTAELLVADSWDRPYSREKAAYPLSWLREHKYWPPVGRIDNVWGDRNLFCTCTDMSQFES